MFNLIKRENGLFDNFFDDMFSFNNTVMKTDIQENDSEYLFKIDLPGYDKKDLKINLDNGYLTVSAERKAEKEEKRERFIRKERYEGSISRNFYVGHISLDSLKASYQDGILMITVPKTKNNEVKYLEIE